MYLHNEFHTLSCNCAATPVLYTLWLSPISSGIKWSLKKKTSNVFKTVSNHHSKLHNPKLSGSGHHVGIRIEGTERNETGMFIQEDCTDLMFL